MRFIDRRKLVSVLGGTAMISAVVRASRGIGNDGSGSGAAVVKMHKAEGRSHKA